MSDDFTQNATTTGYVAVGGTATGEIGSSGDRDWFAVELEAGRTYTLSVTDTTPPPDDFGDTAATAGAIEVGGSVTGEINSARDFDWFALDVVAGHTYVIDLEGSETDAGTLANPQLRGLFDAGGGRLPGTTNDRDGGEGLNSRMTWTAGETGTVYVVARGHKNDTGTYTLSVTDTTPPDDFGATAATAGTIEAGGSVTGEIGAARDGVRDFDWFALDAVAGHTYVIDLEGAETDAGTLANPQLRGLFDADGNRLPGTTNDRDGGEGLNSRMTWTATETGTVYVVARGHRDDTGTYTLSVTDITPQAQQQETVKAQQQETVNAAPVFEEASYEFELAENADAGLFGIALGEVQATDPDGDPVTYSIVSGDPDGLFDIDAATGALSYVGAGEDYESGTTSHELTVRAIGGALHSDVVVTVNVTDVADEEEYVSLQQGTSVSESDGYDLWASVSTTGVVAVGGEASGRIESAGDRDWFAVELEAGKTYRIDLEGSSTDAGTLWNPYLRGVYDADGDLISATENDDGGAYQNSRVDFTAEEDATYYVAAGADGVDVGTYTLSVTDITNGVPDDLAADTDTLGRVTVGGSSTGEIDYEDDRDWFAVELEAGKTYRIDLEGLLTGAGTLWNPYLRGVYDADGDLISDTANDDGGAYQNSRVDFTAEENATYYVAAGGHEDAEGTYTLSVTDITNGVPDDLAADTDTLGRVTVGGSSTGEIDYRNDRDWFAVELEAGKTYQIDLEGWSTDAGTLRDPYLRGVYDEDSNLIPGTTNDNDGHYNSRVYFTAEENATYYVAAGGYKDAEGTYRLSVADVTDTFTDDYAADTETLGTVEVGGSSTGEIDYRGDRDWFAVTLEAGKTYRIDLEGWSTDAGTLWNPYLRGVYDENGDPISDTTNDNGGVSQNSRVDFTAEENATYYVAAGADNSAEGTYTLSVTDITNGVPGDLAAGTETSGTIAVGGSSTGEIDYRGDRDWFAVTLEAGKTYRIDLEGSPTDAGTLRDPYLRGVYDEDSNLIPDTTNDNGGADRNSRVYFTAAENATYYVAAGAFGDTEGTYTLTLSVAEIVDDYVAGTGTSGTVAVGGSSRGEIDYRNDRDWFAVTLEANKTYRIDLEGSRTDAGTLRDPYLHGVHDADGNLILGTANDDGGAGNNSRVEFTAEENATYYVAAGAYRNAEGTYTLSVEEVM